MSLVVRCPGCLRTSQVTADALGLTVRCPRCDGAFLAIEEAELVAPGRQTRPTRNPTLPPPPPRRPVEPPPEPLPSLVDVAEPHHDPHHDPHRDPPGGLPASVLIGLALLPFLIPILWLIAPVVLGQNPVLSVAAPLALATSTSILCIAVIYTIDWSPTLRIKGVLMMVGLAYFAGVTLYFLNEAMVERVKKYLGAVQPWVGFSADGYRVRMPPHPIKVQDQPVPGVKLDCYQSSHEEIVGRFVFVVGSSKAIPAGNGPKPGTDEWFELIAHGIVVQANCKKALPPTTVEQQNSSGRELVIELTEAEVTRVVHVFLIKGRVYYLSIEGPGLTRDDNLATQFFNSFLVENVKN